MRPRSRSFLAVCAVVFATTLCIAQQIETETVVIVKRGDSVDGTSIVDIGWGPSVNDDGEVAFTATTGDFDGVIVGDGAELQPRFTRTGPWSYGNVVQINNFGEIAWRYFSTDGLFDLIERDGPDVGDVRTIAKKDYRRIDNPNLNMPSPFVGLQEWITLNNLGRVVFAADLLANPTSTLLCTPRELDPTRCEELSDYYTTPALPTQGALYPMVSDLGTVIVRAPGSSFALLLMSDETLSANIRLADDPEFIDVGDKPGISDNGKVVAFMGAGPIVRDGIFVVVVDGTTFQGPHKIAGRSGDGLLDPNESWFDHDSNGLVDPGEDVGPFSGFSLIPRVGVNRASRTSDTVYRVVFLANAVDAGGADRGAIGYYSLEVDVSDPANVGVALPVLLAEFGAEIPDIAGSVENLAIYDPVNSAGQSAFWLSANGSPAIVRTDPVSRLDRWWASAGAEPVVVRWNVSITQLGSYTFDVDFAGLVSAWSLTPGATVTVEASFSDPRTLPLNLRNAADLGFLVPGDYTLTVNAFRVPDSPVVESIGFQLTSNKMRRETKALFVADNEEVFGLLPVRDSSGTIQVLNPQEIVERFAPVLLFNSNQERYRMAFDLDRTVWKPLASGVTGNQKAAIRLASYASSGPFEDPASAVVYGSLVSNPSIDELAVNYWFHYPRSNWGELGGTNIHEGDWEGVTVFLVREDDHWKPDRIAFAQHVELVGLEELEELVGVSGERLLDGGVLVPWWAANLQETHPLIYVGLGGHASYPEAGQTSWPRLLPGPPFLGTALEFHFGAVPPLPHRAIYLPPVGAGPVSPQVPDWLLFPGTWGVADLDGDGNPFDGDGGPRGPVFQKPGIGLLPHGQRWLDPWSWSDGFDEQFVLHLDLRRWELDGLVAAVDDGRGNLVLELTEGSDAAASLVVELSLRSTHLLFDYHFVQPGDGDVLSVSVDGELLWTITGSDEPTTGLTSSDPLDIQRFAGRVARIEFRVRGLGGADSQVWIDNISLLRAASGDSDGDGIVDAADNCPSVANSAQTDTDGDGIGDPCETFRRADANHDGSVDMGDAVFLLFHLFVDRQFTTCEKAFDGDDSGVVDLGDVLVTLNFLFLGGKAPAAPFAECGVDPQFDFLTCESHGSCL